MSEQDSLRAQSLKFVEDEDLTYQSVSLPGGVTTPGHDRSYLTALLFGDDFSGRSFLDIGSYLGFFCIEAMKRGAGQVVGLDTDITNVRKAAGIARLWGLSPQYIHDNFEHWDARDRRFDVVACLNVLHHFYDPVHALHKMMALARSRVVLEVAVPTVRDVIRDRINPLRLVGLGAPAIFLGIPRKRGDAAGRTFLFTPRALEIIFNVHTTMFEPITVTRSPFKGRIVVEARKRQIGHLVVVAGPTSSGKSTLTEALRTDVGVRARFGIDGDRWTVVQGAHPGDLAPGRHDRVLLHYDFLRPGRTGIRSHDRDPALHLLRVADKVTVITVVAPRSRLIRQFEAGEIGRTEAKSTKAMKRDRQTLADYHSERYLPDWYEAWLKFCDGHAGIAQVVAFNEGEFAPRPAREWQNLLDG